jgi:hypothetical protein
MTAMIKANPQLPAAIQKLVALATPEMLSEMTGGLVASFPIISYKGKVWRIKKGGEEKMHVDADNNALPSIDVVLVQANPTPSKIFYDKKYEEGTNEAPRCFSNDGAKPDISVIKPINPVCPTCPNNVWGSRITDSGKKSRACADARRMAVVFAEDLNLHGTECQKFLLRVPPASLNPLKDYAEKTLAPKGIPFFAVVTRIGFDVQAAHPQFTLKAHRLLNDEEAEAVIALRGSEDVRRILAEAQEFPAGAAANGQASDEVGTSIPATAPDQPAAGTTAPAANKKAARPADEEEVGIPPAAPPPKEKKSAGPVEGYPLPAPPKKNKAAAPPPPADDEEEPVAATLPTVNAAKPPADFDALLDNILNG